MKNRIEHELNHLPPLQVSPSLFFETLPTELILSCLSYLSPKDLGALALVCRSFNQLANDNLIWKERLRLDANDLYLELSNKTEVDYKLEYRQELDRKLAEKIKAEEAKAPAIPFYVTGCAGFFYVDVKEILTSKGKGRGNSLQRK